MAGSPSFHTLCLQGLAWEEIESYLLEKGRTADEVSLIRKGDRGLQELLSVPMFLTMYALLRGTEGITTRGELMRVFFHERFERRKEGHAVYRQGDISERIGLDGEKSLPAWMPGGKITRPMQWLFLDILLPEIGAAMEGRQTFQITEREARSILQALFTDGDSLYCGRYKNYSGICFEGRFASESLDDVISDFTDKTGTVLLFLSPCS